MAESTTSSSTAVALATTVVEAPTARAQAVLGALAGRPLLLHRPALEALLQATPYLQFARTQERRASGYYTVEGVAVVPIMGTLLKRGTGDEFLDELFGVVSVEALGQTIQRAMADPGVRALLLQIDSPGGVAHGVFDLAETIFGLRGTKPMTAIADEWAFSASYLLASAADRVVVPQTGGVGSIGVYTVRVDMTAMDAALGVRWELIEFGARKADGHPHKPVTEAERTDLHAAVDRIGNLFVAAVARHRGLAAGAIRALEARSFDGADGVTVGLADGVATFADTLLDMATDPQLGGPGTRKETRMDTPKGGEVIALEDHRAKVEQERAAARAEGSAAARTEAAQRVEVFTDMCAAAGRVDLLAGFVGNAEATEATVAKALNAARIAAQTPEVHGQAPGVTAPPARILAADIYAARAADLRAARAENKHAALRAG